MARVLAAAEAAEILVCEGLHADDIETAVIGVPSVIVGRLTNNDPRDIQQAQMSSPFAVAMALALTRPRGDPLILGFDEFEAALTRADVRDLSRKITCVVDPGIEALSTTEYVAARLTIVTKTGDTREALVPVPMGAPERPMRAPELLARFKTMSRGIINEAALDDWVARIGQMDAPRWAEGVMNLHAGEGRS
jgi:2-methylcitrate dehydratase PrpD